MAGAAPGWPGDASSISTSAIDPAATGPQREAYAAPAHIGALPAMIEPVSDAGPKPLRLAALSLTDSDIAPTLPAIEVATPPLPEVLAIEAKPDNAAGTHRAHKHTSLRHHARRAAAHKASSYAAGIEKLRRAPRWAQQMYVSPWQSKAFSYQ